MQARRIVQVDSKKSWSSLCFLHHSTNLCRGLEHTAEVYMLQAFILLKEGAKFFERISLAHWIEGNVQASQIVVTFQRRQYL